MRSAGPGAVEPAVLERVTGLLEQALLSLAEAVQQFERALKLAALHRTRASLNAVRISCAAGGYHPAMNRRAISSAP